MMCILNLINLVFNKLYLLTLLVQLRLQCQDLPLLLFYLLVALGCLYLLNALLLFAECFVYLLDGVGFLLVIGTDVLDASTQVVDLRGLMHMCGVASFGQGLEFVFDCLTF